MDPAIGPLLLANRAMRARYQAHSDRIWQRSHETSLDGVACARIAPEDLLLHVASHLTTRPGATWEKEGRRAGKLTFAETITEYRNQDGDLVVTARSVGVRTERAAG